MNCHKFKVSMGYIVSSGHLKVQSETLSSKANKAKQNKANKKQANKKNTKNEQVKMENFCFSLEMTWNATIKN